jgi:hypothetical protein
MDTNPIIVTKCCSKCGENKNKEEFDKVRRVCRGCRQKLNAEKYQRKKQESEIELATLQEKQCHKCHQNKSIQSFIKCKEICIDCNNEYRRNRYKTDEEFRKKHIRDTLEHKQKKAFEKKEKKLEEIGIGNKKCSCCSTIKPECRFRHNRLKCKDCERDDPHNKFNRGIRSRIYILLKNKTKRTIEYLGCNYEEYHKWIFDHNYNLDNRSDWHIDHVIPLSTFNLDNVNEQIVAFNWRNTTPLPSKENLSKNKKIIQSQLEQHWNKLKEYHIKNNIEMPQVFIDLFAKHLVAGNP